jgi:hypothetical protein
MAIDVRADGTKELIGLTDGYRGSAEAWAGLLRDCARRGMRAPVHPRLSAEVGPGDGEGGYPGHLLRRGP